MRSDISGTVSTRWRVSEQQFLQEYIDEISADIRIPDESGNLSLFNRNRFRGGVEIELQKGTYDVDLVINNPGVTIRGDGANQTEIMGKLTVYAGFTQLYNLAIRGTNRPYALRVMRNPAPGFANISRCRFENLICGGSYWFPSHPRDPGAPGAPVDAPDNAVEVNGVYLTDFKHVTAAFARQNGFHIEATDPLYPSTTLGFTDCSAVKNGRWGYRVIGPCNGFNVIRGNVEQNGIYGTAPTFAEYQEMRLSGVTNIMLQNVDFEGNIPMNDVIFIEASNNGLIEGCSFFYEDSNDWNPGQRHPQRWLSAATCNGIHARGNRTQGFGNGRIGQMDDRGFNNSIADHGFSEADAAPYNTYVQHNKVFSTGHPMYNYFRG